jgi:hypothetical protein
LSLTPQHVEIVSEDVVALLRGDLQELHGLLSKASRSVLFEILEHHAVDCELVNELVVLGFTPIRWREREYFEW